MLRKKLKIALLNKTVFKVKFKFKVEDCVMQISVHQFLGVYPEVLMAYPQK